ncbi:MAG: hypothetical protein F2712_01135 [Actinobacteria bacterium]|nr:hypothetical protein [Actinomycetota bacterium]
MSRLAKIYVEMYYVVLEREHFSPDHHPKSRIVRLYSDRVLRKNPQV